MLILCGMGGGEAHCVSDLVDICGRPISNYSNYCPFPATRFPNLSAYKKAIQGAIDHLTNDIVIDISQLGLEGFRTRQKDIKYCNSIRLVRIYAPIVGSDRLDDPPPLLNVTAGELFHGHTQYNLIMGALGQHIETKGKKSLPDYFLAAERTLYNDSVRSPLHCISKGLMRKEEPSAV